MILFPFPFSRALYHGFHAGFPPIQKRGPGVASPYLGERGYGRDSRRVPSNYSLLGRFERSPQGMMPWGHGRPLAPGLRVVVAAAAAAAVVVAGYC